MFKFVKSSCQSIVQIIRKTKSILMFLINLGNCLGTYLKPSQYHCQKRIQWGVRGARHPPPHRFWLVISFLCNHFEELQTVLFEVELNINNAHLTYPYLNTIETCLIHNHLLFGRQLLYSSNTTSTVVRKLSALSSNTNKINRISNYFLDRWRHRYVVNLRETQRASILNMNSLKINVNDIVLVFYEKEPRHFWELP